MGVSVSVAGASGYAGGELLRLLEDHPVVTPVALGADRSAGATIGSIHPQLHASEHFVRNDAALAAEVDICFSCLPHGALAGYEGSIGARVVVDLSGDHRADDSWVYGLTELARRDLHDATRVANPGCYPTATLLALAPFYKSGLVTSPLVVDALSGASGAGRAANVDLMLGEMHGNVRAYGVTRHRHVPEMELQLSRVAGEPVQVSFTPHLVPIARGLLVTARAPMTATMDDEGALDVLREAYGREPFVRVSEDWPQPKAVFGSNGAVVSARVDSATGMLVASAAIDNLGKGASGQAIQNANVVLGLDETTGLVRGGIWP